MCFFLLLQSCSLMSAALRVHNWNSIKKWARKKKSWDGKRRWKMQFNAKCSYSHHFIVTFEFIFSSSFFSTLCVFSSSLFLFVCALKLSDYVRRRRTRRMAVAAAATTTTLALIVSFGIWWNYLEIHSITISYSDVINWWNSLATISPTWSRSSSTRVALLRAQFKVKSTASTSAWHI